MAVTTDHAVTKDQAGPAGGPAGAGTLGRRRLLRLGLVGAAGLTGAGVVASRWVRSPEQLIADHQAPPPTVLTATVERRVLRDTVVLRGEVGARSTVPVTPPTREQGRPVVTGVRVAPGQEIVPGAVLVEVTGRPLVALPGTIPVYRDLRPGTTGQDVAQLQEALRSLGLYARAADGVLGTATKDALRAFYDSIGYPVPVEGDAAGLSAARDRVRAAERALADETDDRRAAWAREDVITAQAALAEQERLSGPMLPMSEVVFVPDFPARVLATKATLGGEVSAPLLTLAAGPLLVRGRLKPGQRSSLRAGAAVEIHSEMAGRGARGVVSSIGELVTDEHGDRSHPLEIEAAGEPFAPAFAGQDVRITVEAVSTAGEVLVVPISAVYSGADGQTAVLRQGIDGEHQRVTVTLGVSGDGYVEVTPVSGTLAPGDRVIVGDGASGDGARGDEAGGARGGWGR